MAAISKASVRRRSPISARSRKSFRSQRRRCWSRCRNRQSCAGRIARPSWHEQRAGQVDMTDALRSPGSALKPFIYGLAFEDGIAHPETLIEDRPVRYGTYAPENFDLTFQGTVTARRALQMSLNVPAVALLDGVGANRLSARLSQAGAALVLPKGEAPGLAIALRGLGLKLSDLTSLYAGLPRP